VPELTPSHSGRSPPPAPWDDGAEEVPSSWTEPIVIGIGSSTLHGDDFQLIAHIKKNERSDVGRIHSRQIIVVSEPARFIESENASNLAVRSASPTASAIVDAGGLLFQASDIGYLINFARVFLSPDIASRLEELRDAPFDAGLEEKRVNDESVRSFLSYCMKRNHARRPLITATPDGVIQGDWRGDQNERVSIRFFPGDLAWVTLRTTVAHGTVKVRASLLSTDKSPVRLPDWA
jgi:hypothetical protein